MPNNRKREDNISQNRRVVHAHPPPLPLAGDEEYPGHRKRRREIARQYRLDLTSARPACDYIDEGQANFGCAAYRYTAARYVPFCHRCFCEFCTAINFISKFVHCSADKTEDTDTESLPREEHVEGGGGSRIHVVRTLDRSDSCQGSASSRARRQHTTSQRRRLSSYAHQEDPPRGEGDVDDDDDEDVDDDDDDDEGSGVEEGREGKKEIGLERGQGRGTGAGGGTETEERGVEFTDVMEEEETEALEALEAFEAEIEAEAEELETGSRRRRKRARRTEGAPLRPKSAFMCFLSDYRQQYADEVTRMRVADVARHAGQAWRQLDPERRQEYDRKSAESKARYALEREAYDESRGKPKVERLPGQPSRPKGAFLYYLEHFKEERRKQHPESKLAAKVLSQLASEEWKRLTDEQRQPYVDMSQAGKKEYHNWKVAQEAAMAEQRAKVLVPTESGEMGEMGEMVSGLSQRPTIFPRSQTAPIVPGHPLPGPQAQASELLQQVLRMPSQPVGSPTAGQRSVLSGLVLPSESLSAPLVVTQMEGQLLQGRPLAELEGRTAEKGEFPLSSFTPFGSPVSPARATGIGRLLPAPPLAVDLQEQESFSARIRAQIEAQLSSLQQIIALPTPPQLPGLQPLAPETVTAALQMIGSPQPQPQPPQPPPPLAATHPSERGTAGYRVSGPPQTLTPLEIARQQLETAEQLHRLVFPRVPSQQIRPQIPQIAQIPQITPLHPARSLQLGALPGGLPAPQPPSPLLGTLPIQSIPWSWSDFMTDFQRRQFVLLQTMRDIEGAQSGQELPRTYDGGPPAGGES